MKSKTRISILKKIGFASVALFTVSCSEEQQPQERPNILWLTSEDNNAFNHGCYGNEQATTPHIDNLAEEGITYNNAFANATVSAPARFTIITGMYASECGTQHMRSNNEIPHKFRFFPEYLREAGYYCTNNAKEDYNTKNAEYTGNAKNAYNAWNESSNTAHYKNREPGQPFFAVFNSHLSSEHNIHYHHMKEKGEFRHNPKKMDLAPYHPDIPEIRRSYAQYYDAVTELDQWVGEKLKELEEKGVAENTIVFYYGDHGGSLPRSITYIFESGTRVPMIVRFPEKYQHLAPGKPGSREDRLVSFVDLAPTILSLAGIEIPDYLQGRAFLGEHKAEGPEYVHFFRDRDDEKYDMYRAVRSKKYRYIRNYMPHRIYGKHGWYIWRSSSMRAWEEAYKKDRCNALQSRFWETKPAEELYDVTQDPHNVNNLADDPQYRDVLKRMRQETQQWVRENRDPGFLPEAMMVKMAEDRTIYEMTHTDDFPAERIISTAEMATRETQKNLSGLIDSLSARHPAVRYWAATGCAILGEKAEKAVPRLKEMLDDSWANNRIAAAEALCRMGITEKPLRLLVEEMNNETKWVPLHAVNALKSLGNIAKPVEKEIMGGLDMSVKRAHYFKRAYKDMIKDLKPGWSDYIRATGGEWF